MIRRSFLLMAAVAAIAAGCGEPSSEPSATTDASTPEPTESIPTESVPTTPPPAPSEAMLPVSLVSFAEYASVPLQDPDTPPYPGPATPHSLDGVRVEPELDQELVRPGVTEALTRQGFVAVPGDLRLFHFAYQGNAYEGWPVFVTTDAAYHTWHLVFDKLLRSLEQEVLLPKLETLVSGLLEAAQGQTAEVAGTAVEDAASRAEQLFQVAAAELGLPVTLGPLAQEEKALVDAPHRLPGDVADPRFADRLLAVHAARALHPQRRSHPLLRCHVRPRPASVVLAGNDRVPRPRAGANRDPSGARARPEPGARHALA
jgi:hypothetical protein